SDLVIEEGADTAGVVGKQFTGVELFDVLGQHKDGQARDVAACGDGCLETFVGEGGGEADIDDGDVGGVVGQCGLKVGAVVDRGNHGAVVGLQEPDQSFEIGRASWRDRDEA